jgi:hypothetical protein
MKKITIKGKFTTKSANQSVSVEVYTPNSSSVKYDFKKKYGDDFTLTLNDLAPNHTYYIDLWGYTFGGTFTFTITGDFTPPTPPITNTYTNTDFQPGYTINTTP